MTQEDKALLIKDLCARLPYGVVIQEKCIENDKTFLPYPGDNKLVNIDVHEDLVITNSGSRYYIEELKPYLFPLSSMTPEQRTSYNFLSNSGHRSFTGLIDFFNKNHFDYRGLIPKGLAIDCTNLNIY